MCRRGIRYMINCINRLNLIYCLLDFAVHRVLPHDGVVFFQLHAFRRILPVFLRYVPGSAGQAAGFMLRAFEDHLDAVAFAFLCHW